jgi:hypothetical protein
MKKNIWSVLASRKVAKLREVVMVIMDNLCGALRLCVRKKQGVERAEIVVRETTLIVVKIIRHLRKIIRLLVKTIRHLVKTIRQLIWGIKALLIIKRLRG